MSLAEIAQIGVAMADIKAKLEYSMTEVNKVSAAQGLMAADANPWADWVNERLTAQQAAADATSKYDEPRQQCDDGIKRAEAQRPRG